MKYKTLLEETIKSLGIRVYTEGFTAEQIFYQLENKLKDRFSNLEKMIKKFSPNQKKESGLTQNDMNIDDETFSDDMNIEDEIYSDDDMNMEDETFSDDDIENSGNDTYNEDDTNSDSIQDDDDVTDKSENFSSEETIEIEPELWNEESSDSETNQILNLPACEVVKILRKKK